MKFGKLFSLLAATTLALALLASPAFAEEGETVNGGEWGDCKWSVVENGDGGVNSDGLSYVGATLSLSPAVEGAIGVGAEIFGVDLQPWAQYKKEFTPIDKDGDGVFDGENPNPENILITEVVVERGVVFPANSHYLFQGLRYLKSLNLSQADTSNVTNMDYMFAQTTCPFCIDGFIDDLPDAYRRFDLEGLNTESVTSMEGMFQNAAAVRKITLPDTFDTSSVTNFRQMFEQCFFLEEVTNLEKVDTSSAVDVTKMFYQCYSLTSLDISSFDLSHVSADQEGNSGQDHMLDTDEGIGAFNVGASEDEILVGLQEIVLGSDFRVAEGSQHVFPNNKDKNWYKAGEEGVMLSAGQLLELSDEALRGTWRASVVGSGESESSSGSSESSSSGSESASGSTGGTSTSSSSSVSSGSTSSSGGSGSSAGSTAAGSKSSSSTSVTSRSGAANNPAPSATVSSSSGSATITGSSTARSSVSLAKATVALSATAYTYNGKAKKPRVTVKLGSAILKKGTDYTVAYSANKNVGTATVTVTGKGAYQGSVQAKFKIKPKGTAISKLTKAKKSFTVKWKKQAKQTSGYQVRYSTNKSFKSGVRTVTVGKTSATSKKIAKLKSKKTYYVQVRTYKKVNGKTYYSAWSKAKKVTTK